MKDSFQTVLSPNQLIPVPASFFPCRTVVDRCPLIPRLGRVGFFSENIFSYCQHQTFLLPGPTQHKSSSMFSAKLWGVKPTST